MCWAGAVLLLLGCPSSPLGASGHPSRQQVQQVDVCVSGLRGNGLLPDSPAGQAVNKRSLVHAHVVYAQVLVLFFPRGTPCAEGPPELFSRVLGSTPPPHPFSVKVEPQARTGSRFQLCSYICSARVSPITGQSSALKSKGQFDEGDKVWRETKPNLDSSCFRSIGDINKMSVRASEDAIVVST